MGNLSGIGDTHDRGPTRLFLYRPTWVEAQVHLRLHIEPPPGILETLGCPDFGGVRLLDSRCGRWLMPSFKLERCEHTQ